MPQHKSAAKRVRQDLKRRLRNRAAHARVRTLIKDLQATVARTEAEPKLSQIKAYLDRMSTRRLIHPNKAAHAKSQLERFVRALS
jgi:small subunit ribosomal protein S20